MATTTASVAINGRGSALGNASGRLDVTIDGSGSVSSLGTPAITEDIHGSGDAAPA